MECIVACIQLNSQDSPTDNYIAAERLVKAAAADGASFISLPENALLMQAPGAAASPSTDEEVQSLSALARQLRIWMLIGSLKAPSSRDKHYNRSLLITPEGTIAAQYDKIHLFDVTLKDGEQYRESDRITAGDKAVLAETPWGKCGLTICYDVRFPQLYRTLAKAGASIITVPAAFTFTTGSAHWHTLLRARAIETGCFIIAPAQCGIHPGKRRTFGHSLIISPWGEIVAEAKESETGYITARLDLAKVAEARTMIPSLLHDRPFSLGV